MSQAKLELPRWMLFIRIAQVVLCIITLGLTAFAASAFGVFSGFGLNWFVCIWTFAFLAFAVFVRPRLTNINHFLPLIPEIATTFWWLVTFALLASEASSLSALQSLYDAYVTAATDDAYTYSFGTLGNAALGCTKGAAAAGALEFVSFLATVGIYVMAMMRARRAGNPNMHYQDPKMTTNGFSQGQGFQSSRAQAYPEQTYQAKAYQDPERPMQA